MLGISDDPNILDYSGKMKTSLIFSAIFMASPCFAIDTEPAGLLTTKKQGIFHKLFIPKGASVEKCERIGLFSLMLEATKAGRGTA